VIVDGLWFENMGYTAVTIDSGTNITFRKCRFVANPDPEKYGDRSFLLSHCTVKIIDCHMSGYRGQSSSDSKSSVGLQGGEYTFKNDTISNSDIAIYIQNTNKVTILDSRLTGNGQSIGNGQLSPQIILQSTDTLEINRSAVQGGETSIQIQPGGKLIYGPDNYSP
jgi:hypothetical protein